jgi:hypothetical protein
MMRFRHFVYVVVLVLFYTAGGFDFLESIDWEKVGDAIKEGATTTVGGTPVSEDGESPEATMEPQPDTDVEDCWDARTVDLNDPARDNFNLLGDGGMASVLDISDEATYLVTSRSICIKVLGTVLRADITLPEPVQPDVGYGGRVVISDGKKEGQSKAILLLVDDDVRN